MCGVVWFLPVALGVIWNDASGGDNATFCGRRGNRRNLVVIVVHGETVLFRAERLVVWWFGAVLSCMVCHFSWQWLAAVRLRQVQDLVRRDEENCLPALAPTWLSPLNIPYFQLLNCARHNPLPTRHSTLHTSRSTLTLHTLRSTLYAPHFTLHTLRSTLYAPHPRLPTTLHTLHCKLRTPHSKL